MMKLLSVLLVGVLCLSCCPVVNSVGELNDVGEFFVSPGGNDAWNGNCNEYQGGVNGPKKTLANALQTVEDNGTITMLSGTYYEHDIVIDKNVNILANEDVCIDAQENGRILDIKPNCTVLVDYIDFNNGDVTDNEYTNGGAINIDKADVTISACGFTHNKASEQGYGGAIYNNNGTCKLTACGFNNNYAGYNGGAIYSTGQLIIESNVFNQNTVDNKSGAGAIANYAALYNDDGTNIFNKNTPINVGFLEKSIYVSINGCDEWDGLYPTHMGDNHGPKSSIQDAVDEALPYESIKIVSGEYNQSHIKINKTVYFSAVPTLNQNKVSLCGNGKDRIIYVNAPLSSSFDDMNGVTFENINFIDGKASEGGAMYVSQGLVRCKNCDFINNHATINRDSWGGAIYVAGNGWLNIVDCVFRGNEASWVGGAIYNTGAAHISGNTYITLNKAGIEKEGLGGGIFSSNYRCIIEYPTGVRRNKPNDITIINKP